MISYVLWDGCFMKHHLISLVNEDSKAIGLMLAGDLYRGTIEN